MSEELLRFIRNYSHDFLNHLQVISALAQLNRTERIREYIGQVSDQLREITKIAVIHPPELATALLAFQQQVTRYGVPVLVEVQARASGQWPAAPGGEALLRQAFRELGALMGFLEGSAEPVALTLSKPADGFDGFVCEVDLPPTGNISAAELEENLAPTNGLLAPLGARADVIETPAGPRIRIQFPRREV
ncbi:MAG: Spo0B domain-containing protein [Bacillota bacterium]